jgi:bacillithiol system protein YtxJ
MDWINFDSDVILTEAIEKSYLNKGIVIFKHSTRCSISSVAKTRLSLKWNFKDDLPAYYLDLIQYRELSQLVADKFNITHESPQILLIKNGECVYDASHLGISVKNIESVVNT